MGCLGSLRASKRILTEFFKIFLNFLIFWRRDHQAIQKEFSPSPPPSYEDSFRIKPKKHNIWPPLELRSPSRLSLYAPAEIEREKES